jgi:hypothetical protein
VFVTTIRSVRRLVWLRKRFTLLLKRIDIGTVDVVVPMKHAYCLFEPDSTGESRFGALVGVRDGVHWDLSEEIGDTVKVGLVRAFHRAWCGRERSSEKKKEDISLRTDLDVCCYDVRLEEVFEHGRILEEPVGGYLFCVEFVGFGGIVGEADGPVVFVWHGSP